MVGMPGPRPEDGSAEAGGPDPFEATTDRAPARGWRRILIGATLVAVAAIAVDADDPVNSVDRLQTAPTPTTSPTGTTQPELMGLPSVGIAEPAPIEVATGGEGRRRAPLGTEPVGPSEGGGTTPPPIVPRPIPNSQVTPDPAAVAPPWAASTRTTSAGFVATDVGCADGTGAEALDELFAGRMGPVIGLDYQHVYPLGGDRFLWLFQDTFVDHPGVAGALGQASFVHNAAMVQDGSCFTLFHRGTAGAPMSFEPGTGEDPLSKWFWPMGGELVDGTLQVFWVEMSADSVEPAPGDGLAWHPSQTWLAVYDAETLARLDLVPAPNSGVSPIYGYAVASDDEHTYLFGNTFDQNLTAEGGFFADGHSATTMWLARVPRGQLGAAPEYRTADGWSASASEARPILDRGHVENPMQPRYLDGQWVASTKVDGYWGGTLAIDVAEDPWGPWTTVGSTPIGPRSDDPLMNTYHAHLMPWVDGGAVVVSLSQNARDMLRDAWPRPDRYRPRFLAAELVPPPAAPPAPTTTSTASPTTRPSTTTTVRPRPSSTSTTPPTPTTEATSTTSDPPETTARPTTSRPQPTTSDAPTTSNTQPASTTSSTVVPTTSSTVPCTSTTTTSTTSPGSTSSTSPSSTSTSTTSTTTTSSTSSTSSTSTTTIPGGSTTTTTTLPPCRP